MKGIVGRKLGMTQLFDEESGQVTPVTVIEAGPCPVVQLKTEETDGYEAVQLAFDEVAERTTRPGVATGLAWTPTGGDVLFVEVTMMPSTEERLVLTGMLGDVMRESAQAALSWVRTNAAKLGIEPEKIASSDIHIHLPQGAVKKDGPSAGVALTIALVSALTGRPVRNDVAVTGEVNLRGRAMPVGGIKEKVLAAHRAGVRTVLLPRRNEKNLIEDVPASVREVMTFHLVGSADEVIRLAFPAEPAAVEEASEAVTIG